MAAVNGKKKQHPWELVQGDFLITGSNVRHGK